ncbi:hypothetical protein JOB18_012899 [Solea senegalensis]|uniref:Uncharacterized protein n=1 Tax=Solea senegalensis TaxID=28829 RepID=A0AAV6PBR2_SOLSE|nr:hypothetical protein JOB18_026023 [Solea senegalensis]KAG7517624.1 hypothetical protein JOB18_012899 [Solea senegalensis]
MQEPVLHGMVLDCPDWAGPSLFSLLQAAGATTLGQVVELAGPRLEDSSGLASGLYLRSCRVAKHLLGHWRGRLSGHELLMLDTSSGETTANTQDSFPLIQLTPDLKDCTGPHLDRCPQASLQEASGNTFYHLMLKLKKKKKKKKDKQEQEVEGKVEQEVEEKEREQNGSNSEDSSKSQKLALMSFFVSCLCPFMDSTNLGQKKNNNKNKNEKNQNEKNKNEKHKNNKNEKNEKNKNEKNQNEKNEKKNFSSIYLKTKTDQHFLSHDSQRAVSQRERGH